MNRILDGACAVGDFIFDYIGTFLVVGIGVLFYLAAQGPNVSNWTQIDDHCYVHTFHDHRLFAADPAEIRTVYCRSAM